MEATMSKEIVEDFFHSTKGQVESIRFFDTYIRHHLYIFIW